jgi:hypothetical protein
MTWQRPCAFGDRGAQFNLHYLGMWADPADSEANIGSIKALRRP